MSRGKGVSFFQADNFHPDFILWIIADGRQYISFVDPKGISRMSGKNDSKIAFLQDYKRN